MVHAVGARERLWSCAEPLSGMLAERGYAPSTITRSGWALAQLAGLPSLGRLGSDGLVEPRLRRVVTNAVRRGLVSAWTGQELLSVVGRLRRLGLIDPGEPSDVEFVLAAFRDYELGERRLAPLTVQTRVDVLRRFLVWRGRGGPLALEELTVADVHGFVLHEARRLSRSSLGAVLEGMRAFLRFTFASGICAANLVGTLPPIATREHPLLRRAVDAETLARLLGACDRSSPVGRRDYAILILLSRLGLRAVEVAAMRLDDLDWRAGELLVRGKGGREERMPLPEDVGEPLVDYLRHGRPVSPFREVFLRAVAPAGPLGRNGVVFVPRSASARAGLPVVGSHRLRHTAATSLLAAGASWTEVSEVLRHSRTQTTALYTSAEPHLLDEVTHPWPGAQA